MPIRYIGNIVISVCRYIGRALFVTANKFGKNGWPFFGPLCYNLALFWTRFGPLIKSRSGSPGTAVGTGATPSDFSLDLVIFKLI